MSQLRIWIGRQDARHRLLLAVLLAVLAGVLLHRLVRFWTLCIASWDVFALCALLLAWLTILTTPPDKLRRRAQEQDLSRLLIFIFIIAAAGFSLVAVGFLLRTHKAGPPSHVVLHLVMALIAVVGAWSLAHTVFGLRYAHTFYGDDNGSPTPKHAGGLCFPGDREPDYMDFAYFSFVIGMTFQVSDVEITSREMRQLVLIHGMLSFAFNTVILALAINTVSSLL